MAAEEEFDGLDGHMLGRTLAQLTSQQRTLASLKVQLAQAEQLQSSLCQALSMSVVGESPEPHSCGKNTRKSV